jgi:hypothetical protein
MATWVAETYSRPRWNKITSINQGALCGILVYLKHLINTRNMENSKLLTFRSPAATPVCAAYRNINSPRILAKQCTYVPYGAHSKHRLFPHYLCSVRCSQQTQIISPVNSNGLFPGEHKLCARRCTNRSYNVEECQTSIVLSISTPVADTNYTVFKLKPES